MYQHVSFLNYYKWFTLLFGLSDLSLNSQCGGPDLIPSHSKCDLGRTQWHWKCLFSLSLSIHHCFISTLLTSRISSDVQLNVLLYVSGSAKFYQIKGNTTKDVRKSFFICSNRNAFLFFQIMQETNTYIMWPSRLKIGAKTKKGWYQFPQMLLAYTACWHTLSDWTAKGGCMTGAV